MQRVPQLITGYLDHDLNDQEIQLLADALRHNPTEIDRLVLHSFIHSQLSEWMGVRPMCADLLTEALDRLTVSASSHAQEGQGNGRWNDRSTGLGRRSGGMPPHPWRKRLAALAAAVFLAILVGGAFYAIASRPVFVAQLTEIKNCKWDPVDAEILVGTLLADGQRLQLGEGRALITFVSGAQIIMAGPTSLRLDSPTAADLQRGRITTNVPTQAIGFTVTTSCATFIDLGTEFTLQLEAKNACELQVFDGLVELHLPAPSAGVEPQRLRISEGSAVRLNAQSGSVSAISYDPTQRLSL
jgi:hypothetical protein